MERISFNIAKKEGQVRVRYRLREGDDRIQICHRSDIFCDVADLKKFESDGRPKPRVKIYDITLSEQLMAEYRIMVAAFAKMCDEGMDMTSTVFEREIAAIKNPVVEVRADNEKQAQEIGLKLANREVDAYIKRDLDDAWKANSNGGYDYVGFVKPAEPEEDGVWDMVLNETECNQILKED